jgi:hypothetical protein
MKRGMVRLGLSLIVAMGWWVQRLPAQDPPAPPPAPCCPGAAPVLEPGPAGEAAHPERNGLLTRIANRHGMGCYSTHDSPGCGSLHSELTFIFGSCRSFFGEPCQPYPRQPWRERY